MSKSGLNIRCLTHFLNLQKWSGTGSFSLFWVRNSTCASRQKSTHFLYIAAFKNVPRMVCFAHFDFEICFAPHHGLEVFFGICVPHVLRTTSACTFSTAKRPRVLRSWCALCMLTQLRNVLRATTACNFSHYGSAPAALVSLLFNPPKPQNVGEKWRKHIVSHTFFVLFSDSSNLCFAICPYCQKL